MSVSWFDEDHVLELVAACIFLIAIHSVEWDRTYSFRLVDSTFFYEDMFLGGRRLVG